MAIPNLEIKSAFLDKLALDYGFNIEKLDRSTDAFKEILSAKTKNEIKLTIINFQKEFQFFLKNQIIFKNVHEIDQNKPLNNNVVNQNESSIQMFLLLIIYKLNVSFYGSEVQNSIRIINPMLEEKANDEPLTDENKNEEDSDKITGKIDIALVDDKNEKFLIIEMLERLVLLFLVF